MDAKLKAKELVEKFLKLNSDTDSCFGDCNSIDVNICDKTGHGCGMWLLHAKQCALIVVDEIIELVKGICEAFEAEPDSYWNDVKNEIQHYKY